MSWRRPGALSLDTAGATWAVTHASPFVMRDAGARPMWYVSGSCWSMTDAGPRHSCRDARYVIGRAESGDGLAWTRNDRNGGLMPSPEGWDSGMVEYPWVLDHAGSRYLFYNGNDYGGTGVGLAVWEPR